MGVEKFEPEDDVTMGETPWQQLRQRTSHEVCFSVCLCFCALWIKNWLFSQVHFFSLVLCRGKSGIKKSPVSWSVDEVQRAIVPDMLIPVYMGAHVLLQGARWKFARLGWRMNYTSGEMRLRGMREHRSVTHGKLPAVSADVLFCNGTTHTLTQPTCTGCERMFWLKKKGTADPDCENLVLCSKRCLTWFFLTESGLCRKQEQSLFKKHEAADEIQQLSHTLPKFRIQHSGDWDVVLRTLG